jgi:single-stranded-DNA-specific exonuclease
LAKVSESVPDFAVLWGAESEGWHRGVVGIVAAKVRDQIHRPVAVVSVAGDEARGSVRSTPAIHAVHALDAAADMLLSHGGHPAAAGFSILAADLPEFAQRLNDFAAASATASAWTPRVLIEAELSGTAIADAEALAHELAKLEPHGKGNPEPLLLVRNTRPVNLQPLGEKHLRMRVGGLDTVWWSGREHTEALRGPVDLVGTLGFNHWQGRSTVRFTVEDARPCSGSEAPTPDP